MDQAINAFLITVAIICGILSPLLLVQLLAVLAKFMEGFAKAMESKAEEMKKQPPYDDVELNLNPMTKVLKARLIKRGEVVYQGDVSQNVEEDFGSDKD